MRDAKTARRKRPEVMRSAAQHVGIEDVEQVWRMQRQEQVPVYVVVFQGGQVLLVMPRRDALLLQPVRDLCWRPVVNTTAVIVQRLMRSELGVQVIGGDKTA